MPNSAQIWWSYGSGQIAEVKIKRPLLLKNGSSGDPPSRIVRYITVAGKCLLPCLTRVGARQFDITQILSTKVLVLLQRNRRCNGKFCISRDTSPTNQRSVLTPFRDNARQVKQFSSLMYRGVPDDKPPRGACSISVKFCQPPLLGLARQAYSTCFAKKA